MLIKDWVRSRFSIRRASPGFRMSLVTAGISGVLLVAILLNVGLTGFQVMAYLAEDGYAVAQGSVTELLQREDTVPVVDMIQVNMGEALYTRAFGSNEYFVGENKVSISDGFPVFTRSGQVLYFLNNETNFVTSEWNKLNTYEGLYESDGVTFNADSSQADLDEILLVQVAGGYVVAQESALKTPVRRETVAMNSICAFREDKVLFYSFADSALRGESVPMTADSEISIGNHTYP